MEEVPKYEQIGRVIYRSVRILGRLESLCKSLESKLGRNSPDELAATTPLNELNELAPRAVALFTQAYGADSVLTRDVIDQIAALRVRCTLVDEVLAGVGDVVPDDDEFNRLVTCEENLERLCQAVSAA